MDGTETNDDEEGADNKAFDFPDLTMTRAATLDEGELERLADLFSDFPLAGTEQPPIPLQPVSSEHSRDNNQDNNIDRQNNTEVADNSRPHSVSFSSNRSRASSAPTKRKLIINLLVQSFGFLLLFTAYQSLQNLQSSINDDRNIGQTSLAVLYGVLIPSCPFLAPVVMSLLGLKWTITGSMVLYVVFTIANYWLEFYTFIPASVLVGMGAACLWAANGAYLTELAVRYADVSRENLSVVITRFFGIFFGIFQTSQIWGNLISSLVLQQGTETPAPINETNLKHCGVYHCPSDGEISFTIPANDPIRVTLISIYLACGILAVLIMALFADRTSEIGYLNCLNICKQKLPSEEAQNAEEAQNVENEKTSAMDWRLLCDRFIAAWRFLFKEKRMMLLIPLITYGTMQQALNVAVFTRAFVGCTLGVHWIGYVMICYGVCDALSALLIGRIRNWIPRQVMVGVGGLVNLLLMINLLMIEPASRVAVFFVHVGLWGVTDAIWQTQINSLYGVLFPGCQEVAFSMDGFWGAIGYTVAFGYGGYLCARAKIYILMVLLCLSMATYTVLEILERRRTAHESSSGR